MAVLKTILIIIIFVFNYVGGPMGLPLNPNAPQNQIIRQQQEILHEFFTTLADRMAANNGLAYRSANPWANSIFSPAINPDLPGYIVHK